MGTIRFIQKDMVNLYKARGMGKLKQNLLPELVPMQLLLRDMVRKIYRQIIIDLKYWIFLASNMFLTEQTMEIGKKSIPKIDLN